MRSQSGRERQPLASTRLIILTLDLALLPELDPSAIRFFLMACLEHDHCRTSTGLDPFVDVSARSPFQALCHSSARFGDALAKATVNRLLATPRLPVIPAFPPARRSPLHSIISAHLPTIARFGQRSDLCDALLYSC